MLTDPGLPLVAYGGGQRDSGLTVSGLMMESESALTIPGLEGKNEGRLTFFWLAGGDRDVLTVDPGCWPGQQWLFKGVQSDEGMVVSARWLVLTLVALLNDPAFKQKTNGSIAAAASAAAGFELFQASAAASAAKSRSIEGGKKHTSHRETKDSFFWVD